MIQFMMNDDLDGITMNDDHDGNHMTIHNDVMMRRTRTLIDFDGNSAQSAVPCTAAKPLVPAAKFATALPA